LRNGEVTADLMGYGFGALYAGLTGSNAGIRAYQSGKQLIDGIADGSLWDTALGALGLLQAGSEMSEIGLGEPDGVNMAAQDNRSDRRKDNSATRQKKRELRDGDEREYSRQIGEHREGKRRNPKNHDDRHRTPYEFEKELDDMSPDP